MKITNHTREPLSFVVRGKAKDGVPPTGTIAPGATEDLDVDPNDAQLQGRILAGAVSVPARIAEKVEAAQPEPGAKGK